MCPVSMNECLCVCARVHGEQLKTKQNETQMQSYFLNVVSVLLQRHLPEHPRHIPLDAAESPGASL